MQARRRILLAREEIPLAAGAFESAAQEKEKSLFWVKPERLAALDPAVRSGFEQRLAYTLSEKVAPAVKSLIVYLNGAYAASAPEAVGQGQYPGERSTTTRS
jgi:hypothetical protein